jgi:hypothetical protein
MSEMVITENEREEDKKVFSKGKAFKLITEG